MKYKVVGGVTTKDEDWIIEKTLKALDKFCDSIIVYDDGSTDKTEEISKSFDKVEWHVRPKHNPLKREEAKQRLELINLLKPKNADYVMLLDADEVPTPSIIPFIENIDESITTWRIRMINLWGSEDNYRYDKYGGNDWDPFGKEYWGKYPLMKFDKDYDYQYNLRVQKGGCSQYHPAPINLNGTISSTDDFHILHYGYLSEFHLSGKKDEFYAKIEEEDGKGSFERRLNHHKNSKRTDTLKLRPSKKEWFWNEK
jgi:glycosyltransferase involved in cell wall biosynthesis